MDATILIKNLPPKLEFVLGCQMSEVQVKLYDYLMKKLKELKQQDSILSFHLSTLISNHPQIFLYKLSTLKKKTMAIDSDSDDERSKLDKDEGTKAEKDEDEQQYFSK